MNLNLDFQISFELKLNTEFDPPNVEDADHCGRAV
jgi:hypothetical protein